MWQLELPKIPEMPPTTPILGATSAKRVRERAGAVGLAGEEMKILEGDLKGLRGHQRSLPPSGHDNSRKSEDCYLWSW